MPPIEIKPNIYWIGVNDRTTDLFEGLWPIAQEGVSYNTYLIDDEKKAIVADPRGGPYRDIVRAAEKCTAECIHPGTPFNPEEKDLAKLVKRAEKYQ